jgi:hypothetical protein
MGTPLATITIVTGLFILLAGAFQPGAHALHAAAPIVSAENPDSAATRLAPSTFIREPVVERPRAGLSAQPRTGDLSGPQDPRVYLLNTTELQLRRRSAGLSSYATAVRVAMDSRANVISEARLARSQ